MAGNPRWCLSADEWRDAFAGWLDCPDPHALLSSCIFFDFRPVHGDTAPAERLRGWLTGAAAAHERFQLLMARNALAHQPALGLVRDFAVTSGGEHPHTIDLKAGAAGVFVDVARVLALRAGVAATGTVARLRAAAPRLGIAAPDVNAWVRAFQFIQWLRLSSQCAQLAAGGPAHNHVDPYRVDELDRRILRESLRQGRILQDRLARLVQADAPGFGA